MYAKFADYNYEHNNIKKAQLYYEKSFEQGYNEPKVREVYVNSIINSPLDVDAQEKLVKIAEGKIQDTAATRAKYFLYDLKREIHRQYPLNYIKQAPFNQKIVRWNKFPVTYSFENISNIPEEYIEEINNAFSEWERNGNVLFSVVNGDSDIVIKFRNSGNSEMEFGQKYVIAYTIPQIVMSTLKGMEVNFNLSDPEGNQFTRNQIYNTALHEIFHALGFMGHSFDKENIMYLAKDNNAILNDIRSELTEADISTLKLLYKIKPDITNSNELKSEYVPYLILGDDAEVNYSKAKEAKNYIHHAPSLPSGYIDLAESLVAQKRYHDAIKNLEIAERLADTKDMKYIVYYNLAVSYFYVDFPAMALDYIRDAMKIKDTEELHVLKGEVLLKMSTKEAKKEYEYLVQYSPDNIDYAIRLANLYIQDHEYLAARRVLKSFLKRKPDERKNPRLSPYRILLF